MTDDQIEKLIMKEIKKRDITYYDMVSLPDHVLTPTLKTKSRRPVRRGSGATGSPPTSALRG